MNPEERLLLRATRAFIDLRSGLPASFRARDSIDWERFVRIADAHHLSPTIYRLVVEDVWRDVPTDVQESLRTTAMRAATGNALLEREALRLLSRFSEEGIDALVYKGFALGVTCYGDASLRGHQDIDLMLRSADIGPAAKLLESEGYAPEPELARATAAQSRHWCELNFDKPIIDGAASQFHVELHWRVLPAATAIAGEGNEIVPRGTKLAMGGKEVGILEPVDHLLALALHGAKHQWRELRLILDVALLGASLGAREIAALHDRARRWRVRRMLGLALTLAERLGGPRMAETPMEREAAAIERDYLWDWSTHTPSSLFLLQRLDGLSDAARFVVAYARCEIDRHRRTRAIPARP